MIYVLFICFFVNDMEIEVDNHVWLINDSWRWLKGILMFFFRDLMDFCLVGISLGIIVYYSKQIY